MDILKTEKHSGYWLLVSSSIIGLLLTLIIPFSSIIAASAEENEAEKKDIGRGIIINSYGTEMGTIDENGNVSNMSGTFLGSVDRDGNIFNVSMINIGKTTKTGDVMNQSETAMGSVNTRGEMFNVSGMKMGEVKGESDIKRTGGAARLIFLK